MKKPIRVLIVEDEPLVRRMIAWLIEDMGFEVAGKATDGTEGVEMTRTLRPDVVLMDIDMPALDGLDAATAILESCPTPVVLLTAHESPELLTRASAAGVGGYLIKPPNAGDLERAIAIAIARFADLVELRRLNHELTEALAKVRMLSGMLPICAWCKKIRDDKGYWQQVETYVRDHSGATFTHSMCPTCAHKLVEEAEHR